MITAGSPSRAGARRELALALGLALLGSLLVLVAAGRAWEREHIRPEPPLPPSTVEVSGRDVTEAPTALALVGLAGILGVAATRRRGRLVVGGLLVVAGVGVGVTAHRADSDSALFDAQLGAMGQSAYLPLSGLQVVSRDSTAWPWVNDTGGALLAAGGLIVLVRSGGWPSMGARYGAPTTPRAPEDDDTWTRLDRGEDPTDG
jgi:uncharacterized membrane protein (TIGR02234 family)